MFVILGGLFIVGCADLFSKKCDTQGKNEDTSGTRNDTTVSEINVGTNGVCNEETERLHSIIGDTILICAQVFNVNQSNHLVRC